MAKYKVAYAGSALAMVLGAGVLAPATGVFADGDCTAANLEELQTCLAGEAATIATTDTITVAGENVDVTLVTNGKTINGAENKNLFHIEDGAKLTLRGNGTLNAGRYGAVADGAELVIDGPTINAISSTSYGVYAKENGRVTIESGQVVADYAAFAGNNTTGDMNFYVNGGLLKSNRYPAIYMPGQVDLVVRGGTLDGGIMARMGQIMIYDGTINVQDADVVATVDDGLEKNYGGMASVREAIALVGGSYKSTTTDHGNDMNVTISGGRINGEVALYDMGNEAAGYAQNIKVEIAGGTIGSFNTKFTDEEIGFALKSGYTAGANNAAGRVSVEISGGTYTTEPDAADIAEGDEVEYDEKEGVYKVLPKEANMADKGAMESDGTKAGALYGNAIFNRGFVTDRKAYFELSTLDDAEIEALVLSGAVGGDLILPFDASLWSDRDGVHVIDGVENTSITIRVILTEEQYNTLKSYSSVKAVYFGEDGKEAERLDAVLGVDGDNYYVEFTTAHLSTYGIVGVNEAADEESENEATTPETGTMTREGGSAMVASIIAAAFVGVMTSVVSFAYLIRRK